MKDRYRRKLDRVGRQEQRRQSLASPHPVCTICGATNLLALTRMPFSRLPGPIQRRVLEKHHMAGRAAGASVVIVCRNCHAVLSDAQYDWDERLRHPRTRNERLAAHLRGLADMFRQEGATRSAQADDLDTMTDELISEHTDA